jgi:hypothetical protein
MKLLQEFYEYTQKAGFDKSDIYEEKTDEYTVLSFYEAGEKGTRYNVALVFYEDENAEVYIRKMIKDYDLLRVLSDINSLNSKYLGVTFFIADDMITVKSYCKANGEIGSLLKEMVQDMKLAQKEFINF